ncbi:MAG: NAD-dependent protein deacetylase [Halomonas sp.]|uniref:NAD-dependent protein deacetylase n=1 Tax=Halomonas sp. TaxID=1486246 RepID=UPI003F925E55
MTQTQSAPDTLLDFVQRHSRLTVLTGAGISTASGIPDYRDAEGNWKHSPPMQHQEFMGSHGARQRYWARALVGFRTLEQARPNTAHAVLARLEARGLINGIITQNVDGLHQRAGSKRVIDLHGRADRVRCMGCDMRRLRHELHAELAERNPDWLTLSAAPRPDGDADLERDFSGFEVPACQQCQSGVWKPDVVFFGDSVPASTVKDAMDLLADSNGLLVVGSSLMVFSGFRFVRAAVQQSKPIACLNLGRTRADDLYQLKVSQSAEPALVSLEQGLEALERV